MILKPHQKGVTLLEALLALAVIALIITFTLRQYSYYQRQSYFTNLQYNVDQLFQAMRNYYSANCFGSYDSTGTLIPGTLNPANTALTSLTAPKPINLQTDLLDKNYLSASAWHPENQLLISGAAPPDYNIFYYLQFNPYQPAVQGVTINSCTTYQNPPTTTVGSPRCDAITPTQTSTISNTNIVVLNWSSQVAVQLPGNLTYEDAQSYMLKLDATCVSQAGTVVNTIEPCSSVSGTLTPPLYLVWERMPSFSSQNSMTTYWQSLPGIKQFNLQYTHDQMMELQGYGTTVDGTSGAGVTSYYLCGG